MLFLALSVFASWPRQNCFLDFIFKICKVQEWVYVNTKISSGSKCPYLDHIFKNTHSRKLCLFETVTILFSTCSFWKLVLLIGSKLSYCQNTLAFLNKTYILLRKILNNFLLLAVFFLWTILLHNTQKAVKDPKFSWSSFFSLLPAMTYASFCQWPKRLVSLTQACKRTSQSQGWIFLPLEKRLEISIMRVRLNIGKLVLP